MYVCMYVCVYVCMYVCIYVYTHVCMYVCMSVCMYSMSEILEPDSDLIARTQYYEGFTQFLLSVARTKLNYE
jgi:hypothetical protein